MLIRDPRTRFEAIEAVLENAVKAIPDETKRIEWFESCLERAAVIAHVPTFAGEMAYRAPAIFS